MKEFGEYLRNERLAHGITLEEIERRTRIRKQHLTAIEAGEFQRLPEAAYVRAFLRHYATCVGLDPQGVIEQYEQLHNASAQSEVAAASTGGRSERRMRQLRARRRRRAWQWAGVFLILAILAGIQFSDEIQSWMGSIGIFSQGEAEADTVTGSNDTGPGASGAQNPTAQGSDPLPTFDATEVQSAPEQAPSQQSSSVSAGSAQPSTYDDPVGEVPAPPSAPPSTGQPAIDLQSDPIVVPVTGDVNGFTLGLVAHETSWAELHVDGERVLYRNLEPGEQLSYVVTDEASLRLGRASDVVLYLNGEPMGAVGSGVVSKRFVADALQM